MRAMPAAGAVDRGIEMALLTFANRAMQMTITDGAVGLDVRAGNLDEGLEESSRSRAGIGLAANNTESF
jgi:hypothetical protein